MPGKKKPDKIPYNPITKQRVSSVDPSGWCDFHSAQSIFPSNEFHGVGFIIDADDPFGFVDIDGCITWRDGQPVFTTPEMQAAVAPLLQSGAMWEYSQSGTGLHIIARVDKEALADRRKRWPGWEFYRAGRFCAFGHFGWQGDPNVDITSIMSLYAPADDGAFSNEPFDIDRTGPVAEWAGPSDDTELLQRAIERSGKNNPDALFGGKATFEHIWNMDAHSLAGTYPPDAPRTDGLIYDASAVDQALMSMLAFWTGKDLSRMIRLFQQWPGYRRFKYETRHGTYLMTRLVKNGNKVTNVYQGNYLERRNRQRQENEVIGEDADYNLEQTPILTVDQCVEKFLMIVPGDGSGKVFVGERDTRRFYSWQQAIIKYAGSVTPVTKTNKNGEESEKLFPTLELWKNETPYHLNGISWSPNHGEICPVDDNGSPGFGFNTWRGLIRPKYADYYRDNPQEREQWLQRWNQHLDYLIPAETHVMGERKAFEQWLGHIVQHPGELPQFAWLFITETTGIGRNWVASVLSRVLRGHVAPNIDFSEVMNSNFTGRFSRKLLAVVDETKAGMEGRERWTHKERIKNLINGETRFINVKGGAQYSEVNAMRWLFFSNNWDAIALDRNDRRFNVAANPEIHPPNREAYYTWLYEVLNDERFISAVFAHLEALPLDGFNPGANPIKNQHRERVMTELSSEVELSTQDFLTRISSDIFMFKDLKAFVTRSTAKTPSDRVLRRVLNTLGASKCEGPFKYQNTQYKSVWIKPESPLTAVHIKHEPQVYIAAAIDAAVRMAMEGTDSD